MVRFLVLGLTLALAGCAAAHLAESLPDAAGPQEVFAPNHRQIVADSLASVFTHPETITPLEISSVRPVNHLTGPAWLACLRIQADRAPQEYALFIQGDKIIDQRVGVAIDHCKQQTYEPFDPESFKKPVNPPPAKSQRKAGR